MAGRLWTHDEEQMAFALYYLIPANEIDKRDAEVWRLAEALGRTPRSVAMKLWNIAALDEGRVDLGRAGLPHGSALDARMWDEFRERGDDFVWEGIDMLGSALKGARPAPSVQYAVLSLKEGRETIVQAKRRVNQNYFRNRLKENYGNKCCLTGIRIDKLLVASHIKPWAACEDRHDRLDPRNGLLLNALHDRAFDSGLITLDKGLRIVVSGTVPHDSPNDEWLWRYSGEKIALPSCNAPAPEFIEYHRDCVFVA